MSDPESLAHPVCAVTVTYGARRELVGAVLDRLAEEGVAKVVVVCNGVPWEPAELSAAYAEGFVELVCSEENTGSAGGFRLGLERAAATGLPFLLVLDDDNLLARGGVGRLLAQFEALGAEAENVLLALRLDRGDQREAVTSGRPLRMRRNAFLGFHVLELPLKIARRLRRHDGGGDEPRWMLVPAEKGPYGGLFLRAEWVQRCGLPDERMFLYADDLEYTMRLCRAGAAIHLFAGARIEDIDASWSQVQGGIASWLAADSPDARVYYSIRNHVWVEQGVVTRRWVYRVNVACYLLMLACYGALFPWRHGNLLARLRLIVMALRDGLRGELDRRF